MFVIAGITGQTGSAAAEALLRQGRPVRGLVRDRVKAAAWTARGAELAVADLADREALRRAFEGAAGAYALVPPALTHSEPMRHYEAVAAAVRDAAKAAGLPRLVFLSSEGAHLDSGTGAIRGVYLAERILADAAPAVTFLRAAFFQENWLPAFGLAAQQGIVPTMLADLSVKRSMVATADIGRTAAELLLRPDAPAIVELGGPEPTSAADATAAMSAALGRPLTPVQPPRDQWVPILTGAGIGAPYAALIAEMYDGINSGHVRFSGQGEARHGTVALADTIRGWAADQAA